MSSYQHKSGAQKRRERADKEEASTRNQQTLSTFGFSTRCSSEPGPEKSTVEDQRDEATEIKKLRTEGNREARTPKHPPMEEEESSSTSRSYGAEGEMSEGTTVSPVAAEEGGKVEYIKKQRAHDFDIGSLPKHVTPSDIQEAVLRGTQHFPEHFPNDKDGHAFPTSILHANMQNGEKILRDWLSWSRNQEALFCVPCRLFSKLPTGSRSALSEPCGYSRNKKWRKLHDKVPEHEDSKNHKMCYIEWRKMERAVDGHSTVGDLIDQELQSRALYWKQLLHRLLSVTVFLGERGLAFRGTSDLVGDRNNGNYLGILELMGRYDPILAEHLSKVKQAQKDQRRLQVHYLSHSTQNEFIQNCGNKVLEAILAEREAAKYFSVIVDATPDSSHVEQTVFIIRYVYLNPTTDNYEVKERFLEFVDCNRKTGGEIATLICNTLKKHNIPIADCRGQGYDNGSNMSGAYRGAQAFVLRRNSLAVYSPCGCHSLNLCGVHAAECCPQVITFFGVVQKLYNLFSSSPQRWEILRAAVGHSVHSLSTTRWSARVEAVRALATHLPGIIKALEQVKQLNLTAEAQHDVVTILKYLRSFDCILMANIWLKVLTAIDIRNKVLQAREATLDVEVENIRSLIDDLQELRGSWVQILGESKQVAENAGLQPALAAEKRRRNKKKFPDGAERQPSPDVPGQDMTAPEITFKTEVFYRLMDCLLANMATRFEAANQLSSIFGFLWNYSSLDANALQEQAKEFSRKYGKDVFPNIAEEVDDLKMIHAANLGSGPLAPLALLNKLHTLKLDSIFPNVCVGLRIFCTLPTTVAQAERSFSVLARVKNFLRSTMGQGRLTSLGMLAIESDLAKEIDFDSVITAFAAQRARKTSFV